MIRALVLTAFIIFAASGAASAQDAIQPRAPRGTSENAIAVTAPTTSGSSMRREKARDEGGADMGSTKATPRICTNCDD